MLRLHHSDTPTPGIPADVMASGIQAPIATLPTPELIRSAVWVDLAYPLPHEVAAVEAALGLRLPTRADMVEIEASSRVSRQMGARVMNVLVVVGLDSDDPAAVPVSLILTDEQLVTVRYADPQPFRALDYACTKQPPGPSAFHLFVRLLDHMVDRTADVLERMGGEIDSLSRLIFARDRPKSLRLSTDDLQTILRRIGNTQFVVNKAHDSLLTLQRAIGFLQLGESGDGEDVPQPRRRDKQVREQLKSVARDVTSLSENSEYLSQNIGFLLDAALGRISIEQNAIIKIFSVAAVVFLPPPLVGTIYGMNFTHMPELSWRAGYPMAVALMLLSAILPYLWFKRKGWL